jgi:hypothetical protein
VAGVIRDTSLGMNGQTLQKLLEAALPREKVLSFARTVGALKRESLIHLDSLVNALVLTARTPSGGRQADVLRAYIESTGVTPVRGTFYARFNSAFEELMEALLKDGLAAVQGDRVLLPRVIDGVRDWVAIDSETVKLHDSLKDVYPGTGDYAAVKVHKMYSIGRHNLIDYKLSPARDHDSKFFQVTEDMRGLGLLMDLAYASHARLRACEKHGVSFVVKLKSRWKAKLQDVYEGELGEVLVGTDFVDALNVGSLRCENGRIDADVKLGSGSDAYVLRLVVVETPEQSLCVFLTNLGRKKYPASVVGDLYRLRWEIEKNNKVDKSDLCLADLDCQKPCSARAMIYASLLGTSIAGRVVHADHCEAFDAQAPLRRGPLHVRLVAMALASAHGRICDALESGDAATWTRIAATTTHLSSDPNWRRRPSVLDKMLGFTAPPGRTKRSKAKRVKSPRIAIVEAN